MIGPRRKIFRRVDPTLLNGQVSIFVNTAYIMKKLLGCLAVWGLLSCHTAEKSIEPMNTASQAKVGRAFAGTWRQVEVRNGKNVETGITLEIAAEKDENGLHPVTGRGPVNLYMSQAVIDEAKGTIRMQVIGSTKMAGPPEDMQKEFQYFERLANIRGYSVSNDLSTLIFTLNAPQVGELRYTRVSR